MAVVGNNMKPLFRHCSHRMRGNSNGRTCDAQRLNTIEICIDRGVTEAALAFLWWLTKATLSVGCHKQDDPYTCITPGLYYSFRHGIGISIGLPARSMMYIVELSHAGISSRKHLPIGM